MFTFEQLVLTRIVALGPLAPARGQEIIAVMDFTFPKFSALIRSAGTA